MQILLSPKDAAQLLGLTTDVLAALRRSHCGPPFLRITARSQPRYRLSDVALWATMLAARACVGCASAYDAATQGEENHNTLRDIAQHGADTGQAACEDKLLHATGAAPGTRTRQ
jgi:hypothetical protein